MRRSRTSKFAGVGVSLAFALIASACGSDSPSSKSTTSGASGTGPRTSVDTNAISKACPVAAFTQAPKPVKIVYWHSLKQANETALIKLADSFNASQHDVQVTLKSEGSNEDILTKYKGVAGSDNAPDLFSQNETNLQQMIDSNAIVPAQACLTATHSNVDDLLDRVRGYYTVSGALWATPFNVSQPVLLYNKTAFRNAGFDPDHAPMSLEDLATAAKEIGRAHV